MEKIKIHLAETNSTSNWLRQWLDNDDVPSYSSVSADFQTAGRGQYGNSWESEKGKNLLISFVVRPLELDIHQQFYLSMAIAIAIAESISKYISIVKIKWPNDIYINNNKIAGILIENTLRGSIIYDTIIGLGLNINQTKFISDAPNPISMKQITNTEYDIQTIADEILLKIQQYMLLVDNKKWKEIKQKYMSLLYQYDNCFHTFCTDTNKFEAKINDILPDGRLVLIDKDQNKQYFYFKEVKFNIK